MAPSPLPDKQYFKIGEVAKIVGVKPSVLRYWETEFRSIRPEKSRSNQRLYARRTVEHVLRIRELLYEQGFTIAGARKKLREDATSAEPAPPASVAAAAATGPDPGVRKLLARARRELQELLQLVDE